MGYPIQPGEEAAAVKLRALGAIPLTTTGSANAYLGTYSLGAWNADAPVSLPDGVRVIAQANFTNTDAPTFNFTLGATNYGAKAIKELCGASVATAVGPGRITSGVKHELVYRLTGDYWEMISGPTNGITQAFELDGNGDLMPVNGSFNDPNFTLTALDEVTPVPEPQLPLISSYMKTNVIDPLTTGKATDAGAKHQHQRIAGSALCNVAGAGTQTITHNLGRVPNRVAITAYGLSSSGYPRSFGTFDGLAMNVAWGGFLAGAGAANVRTDAIIYISFGSTTVRSAVITNLTATTFDLVWTGGATTDPAFLWEVE